jgi:6-phosphogluconolactonase (cycloisomerase 2 family)
MSAFSATIRASKTRNQLLLTIIAVLCCITCASAQTITAQYLYAFGAAPSGTQGRIAGYRIATDGTLTQTQGAFPTSEPIASTVPSAQGAKLFALGIHKLWVFAVNPADGTLKLLSSDTFPQNIQGSSMAINPASTLLFVLKAVDPGTANEVHRITTYKIASTGVITSVASSVVQNLLPNMAVDNSGRFLYANVGNPDFTFSTDRFSINSTTGALTFAGASPSTSTQPINIVIHANNTFVYEGEQVSEVGSFKRNATTGALAKTGEVQCNCDTGPDFGGAVALNPHGTVLVEATGQDSGLAIYTIDQTTGLLTPQGGSFIDIPFGLPPFTIDKANGFLYAINLNDKTINSFHVTDAGVTSPTAQGHVPPPADMAAFGLQVLAVKR